MSKQLESDSDSYDTDDKRAKLYYRHMRAVLKSPILQKVYIYYGDDGNPDPKVKIGIDISRCSESSVNDGNSSATNERITNSFDLESDRVTNAFRSIHCISRDWAVFPFFVKKLIIFPN